MTNEQQLRLAALKLAAADDTGSINVVNAASKYYDFLIGKDDAPQSATAEEAQPETGAQAEAAPRVFTITDFEGMFSRHGLPVEFTVNGLDGLATALGLALSRDKIDITQDSCTLIEARSLDVLQDAISQLLKQPGDGGMGLIRDMAHSAQFKPDQLLHFTGEDGPLPKGAMLRMRRPSLLIEGGKGAMVIHYHDERGEVHVRLRDLSPTKP